VTYTVCMTRTPDQPYRTSRRMTNNARPFASWPPTHSRVRLSIYLSRAALAVASIPRSFSDHLLWSIGDVPRALCQRNADVVVGGSTEISASTYVSATTRAPRRQRPLFLYSRSLLGLHLQRAVNTRWTKPNQTAVCWTRSVGVLLYTRKPY